jgi:hypothetical protein
MSVTDYCSATMEPIVNNNADVFTDIFQNKVWGRGESVSGSGSQLNRTRHLRAELPLLLNDLNIKSVLDLPCGDFNWMRFVELNDISYVGGDIVLDLVERNRTLYATPNRQFKCIDIISSSLPKADAVLCRDCLVHLPHADIFAALRNICESGALYLLTTHFTFRSVPANDEIAAGQWRRLNLELAPFYWPPPQRYIVEGCDEQGGLYADKSLAVWPVDQIRTRLR